MRANLNNIEIENYKFLLELDTGGDPDYPYTLWIYQDGEPLTYTNTEIQVRKEFKKGFSEVHLRNFCLKFVNKKSYRDSIINKYIVGLKE